MARYHTWRVKNPANDRCAVPPILHSLVLGFVAPSIAAVRPHEQLSGHRPLKQAVAVATSRVDHRDRVQRASCPRYLSGWPHAVHARPQVNADHDCPTPSERVCPWFAAGADNLENLGRD